MTAALTYVLILDTCVTCLRHDCYHSRADGTAVDHTPPCVYNVPPLFGRLHEDAYGGLFVQWTWVASCTAHKDLVIQNPLQTHFSVSTGPSFPLLPISHHNARPSRRQDRFHHR